MKEAIYTVVQYKKTVVTRIGWYSCRPAVNAVIGIAPNKYYLTNMGTPSLHQLAFDKAAQPNIISRISSGKIVTVNHAACKLLGYSKKQLTGKSWLSVFEVKETKFKRMLVQRDDTGHCAALVCVIKKGGKTISCDVTSAFFEDADGTAMAITTINDRSKSIRHQKDVDISNKKMVADNITVAKSKQRSIDTANKKTVAGNIKLAQEKSDKSFSLIFNSSSDILYDIDLLNNIIILSDAYEKEFGYKIKANMSPVEDWSNHIHPDDKGAVIENYTEMLQTDKTEWKYSFRFLKADRSIADILSSAIILRDGNGNAYRMLGSMHDNSRQIKLEKKLAQQIELKENEVAAAMEKAKETERSDLGKELHDNVNQLLAASRMYLDMAKRGGTESETYLGKSSEYTMMAIEEIRKLSKRLTTDNIKTLGLRDAIETISQDTMEVSPLHISCELDSFKESSVTEKFKVTVFRIVQEQLTNILKHAKARKVKISLVQDKDAVTLSMQDNGVGFDTSGKRKGIGVVNIKDRAATFNGTADFVSQPGKGCILKVILPVAPAI